MNKSQQTIVYAYDRGYATTVDGRVWTPDDTERQLNVRKATSRNRSRKYYRFTIWLKSGDTRKAVNILAHQFVAYCKYFEFSFCPTLFIKHRNGNTLDNRWKNIMLGTKSEIMMSRPKKLRVEIARHANRKYDDATLAAIMTDYNKGWSYKQLMKKHGIRSKGTLNYIINESMSARLAQEARQ